MHNAVDIVECLPPLRIPVNTSYNNFVRRIGNGTRRAQCSDNSMASIV